MELAHVVGAAAITCGLLYKFRAKLPTVSLGGMTSGGSWSIVMPVVMIGIIGGVSYYIYTSYPGPIAVLLIALHFWVMYKAFEGGVKQTFAGWLKVGALATFYVGLFMSGIGQLAVNDINNFEQTTRARAASGEGFFSGSGNCPEEPIVIQTESSSLDGRHNLINLPKGCTLTLDETNVREDAIAAGATRDFSTMVPLADAQNPQRVLDLGYSKFYDVHPAYWENGRRFFRVSAKDEGFEEAGVTSVNLIGMLDKIK